MEFLELEARQSTAVGRKIYGPDSSGVYGGNQGVGGLLGTIDGATYVPIVEDYFGNVSARIASSTWQ